MASVFRPATAEDETNIIALMTRAFCLTRDRPFLSPAMLQWKYWQPRGDFSEPRSYVMERDGRLVAHAGLWPVIVDGERGVHMIDWASDPAAPGAGVSLLQKLTQRFDFIYSIGGSDMTEDILPKFGFRVAGEAHILARPLRPVRQALDRAKDVNWRAPARLGRNLWWSKLPWPRPHPGWSFVLTNPGSTGERDPSFFNYLKRCPAARCLTFQIRKGSVDAGTLALAVLGGQARVIGVWLRENTVAHWRIASELAQKAVLAYTDAREITARTASENSFRGAIQAGMRQRGRTKIFLYKKRGTRPGLSLNFQFGDNDEMFLSEGSAPRFLT